MTTIDKTKLEELQKLVLADGAHDSFAEGACAMEAVAWLANEPHSDSPQCACPVIAAFVRSWNDSIPGEARRTKLLLPLVPLLVNSRGSDKLMLRRLYLAIDWDIRTRAAAWLRLAGLEEHAETLECLPEISTFRAMMRTKDVAVSARDAARDAAYNATRSAVWGAAWAARGAANAAAWAAASAAVNDAAWADSLSAAKSQLDATVRELQASAQDLVRRMCALTEADVEAWSWEET